MSIRVMSRVWEESEQQGAALLVLLALADWANDRGECDPSYQQLADKARIDKRRARRIVADLKISGDVEVQVGRGFAFQPWAVSNRLVLARYAAPEGARALPPRGARALPPVVPAPSPPGAPVPPTTVNNNGHQQQSTPTLTPPVVVVQPPAVASRPAPADDDDGAGEHAPMFAAILEAMTGATGAVPSPYTLRRAKAAAAKLARVAPGAGPEEVATAAEDWQARMSRRKPDHDPITADQLVEAVTALASRPRRRRFIPHIEY